MPAISNSATPWPTRSGTAPGRNVAVLQGDGSLPRSRMSAEDQSIAAPNLDAFGRDRQIHGMRIDQLPAGGNSGGIVIRFHILAKEDVALGIEHVSAIECHTRNNDTYQSQNKHLIWQNKIELITVFISLQKSPSALISAYRLSRGRRRRHV